MRLRLGVLLALVASAAVPSSGATVIDSVEEWTRPIADALAFIDEGDYPHAEAALTEALEMAERAGAGESTTAFALSLLGSVYLELGRYREAEVCDRRALLITQPGPPFTSGPNGTTAPRS